LYYEVLFEFDTYFIPHFPSHRSRGQNVQEIVIFITPCTCTQWGRIGFNPSVVWDEDVLCYTAEGFMQLMDGGGAGRVIYYGENIIK